LSPEDKAVVLDQALHVGFNSEISFGNKSFLQEVLSVHYVIDVRRSQLEDIRQAFHDHGLVLFLQNREYLWDGAFPMSTKISYSPNSIKTHIVYQGSDPSAIPPIMRVFEEIIDELAGGISRSRKFYLQCKKSRN